MMKFSLIFRYTTISNKPASWSETWYYDGSVAQALSAADATAKRRSAIMTRPTVIVAARIQQIGSRATIFKMDYPGVVATNQDIPQMALNVRVSGSAFINTKTFQLRGLPDANVDGGDYVPTAAFNTGLRNFCGSLSSNAVRFRGENLANPQVKILGITNAGVMTLAGDLVYNEGDTLTLLRVKNTQGRNVSGKYYVSVKTSARICTLAAWTGDVVTNKGAARKFEYVYPIVQADSLVIGDVTTRKVGRPFGLYRGRATTR